jgi:hypothetical protein
MTKMAIPAVMQSFREMYLFQVSRPRKQHKSFCACSGRLETMEVGCPRSMLP